MQAEYNYSEIADAICKRIDEHITLFNLKNVTEKVWDMQVQVNKCKHILEYLKNKKILSQCEKWLLSEISNTVDYFEKIMKAKDDTIFSFDEYLRRINSISAIIAYCASFGLEDCNIFYNIYKNVLEKQNLKFINKAYLII